SRHIDYIVNPSKYSVITVVIPFHTISCEIHSLISGEIGFPTPIVITIGRPNHSWPRKFNTEVTLHGITRQFISFRIHNHWLYARQGQRCVSWLGGGDSRHRRNHDPSVLRLPPSIHDRASGLTNTGIVPIPCFFVYRFPYRPKNF